MAKNNYYEQVQYEWYESDAKDSGGVAFRRFNFKV